MNKLIFGFFLVIVLSSCQKDEVLIDPFSLDSGTFIDSKDNQEYEWVRIGNQVWMSENYRYADTSGSYIYDNLIYNDSVYGKLYSWESALRNEPEGWHLPTHSEWLELSNYLGGDSLAGGALKDTSSLWFADNFGATNESGFKALPGGNFVYSFNYPEDSYFIGDNTSAYFWTNTKTDLINIKFISIWYDRLNIVSSYTTRNDGLSVRYVKD
jgi:uncharacterized protein (TIGR02145 family)